MKTKPSRIRSAKVAIEHFLNQLPIPEGELSSDHFERTPDRVALAFLEYYTIGYEQDPKEILSTKFEEHYDEVVVLKSIPFYSLCAHHLVPFHGHAAVAYLPDTNKGYVVGLSKLARLVDVFARRLQVQERMTRQIATALQTELKPKGVAVVIEAEHLCLSSRGACKPGAKTVTSYLIGCFRDDPSSRAEVLSLMRP